MSWLHSLLVALSQEELVRLKKIQLIGKEKMVLSCMLNFIGVDCPSPKAMSQILQLNEAHYYKINSILLDKIYLFYQPEGEYELLVWLKKRELYPHFKNEIKAQNKSAQTSSYYLKVFRLLIDLPYKFYDEKLSKEISNAYLNALMNCSESDKMHINFHLLFADCNRFAATMNPKKKFPYSESDLLKMEIELQGKGHSLAEYYLYRTFCNYYKYYKKEIALSLSYLQKAIELKDRIAEFFPIDIRQFLRLLYADALLSFNEVQNAYSLYSEVFKEGIDDDMYGFHYHCEQYALCAILLKKYKEAEQLIDKYFDACIKRRNDIYATRGALAYAKLYLNNGEFKKAQSYIQLGIEINEKSFYLPFEIQLRALENIYFYLIGDYEFAKQLALRNAKFIANQKSEELYRNYRHFFKLITSLIKCIEQKKIVPLSTRNEAENMEVYFRNLYGNLIQLMCTKADKN